MGYRAYVGAPALNPRLVPTQPVAVDRAHPLAVGLTEWFVFGSQAGFNGLFSGTPTNRSGTSLSGVSLGASAIGPAAVFSTGALLTGTTVAALLPATGPFSVTALVVPTAVTGNPSITGAYTGNNGNASGAFQFGLNTSNQLFVNRTNQVAMGNSTTTVALNVVSHVGVTYDASGNLIFYVNGVAGGTASSSQTFTTTYTGAIGFDDSNPQSPWIGQIVEIKYHARLLAAGEMAQLATEPFAMLRPVVRRQYYQAPQAVSFTWLHMTPDNQPAFVPPEMVGY
jgi:hypothetical protein